jgi:hypothetical protein
MKTETILIEYKPKPIPVRGFDWEAYRPALADQHTPIGYGLDAEEALYDLLEREGDDD